MSDYMSTDRLLGVCSSKHCTAIDLSHHLVGDDHGDTELVSHALQVAQEASKTHLSIGKLASACVVCAVEVSG